MTFSLPLDPDRVTAKRVVLVTIEDFPSKDEKSSLRSFDRLLERGARATMRVRTGTEPHMRWLPLVTGLSRSSEMTSRNAVDRVEPVPKSIASAGFQTSVFLPDVDPQTRAKLQLVGRQLGFQHISFRGSRSPDILRSAVPALCNQRRGLIAIHFPNSPSDPNTSWKSSDFLGHNAQVDQSLGILASLSGAFSADTVLIVAASPRADVRVVDSPHEMELNVIFCGRPINSSTFDGIEIVDVSATLISMLGISIPPGHEGRPLAPPQYASI